MRVFGLASAVLPLAVVLTWAALVAVARAGEVSPGVQIVKGTAMEAKIASTPPSPGGRGGVIAEEEGWRVHVAERDAPGLAELHEGDTDIWYVIEGSATIVTGGALVHPTRPGPGERRAPSIENGAEHAIAAGDLVTIRPGVPHWIKAVDGRVRYLTVKVHARPSSAR